MAPRNISPRPMASRPLAPSTLSSPPPTTAPLPRGNNRRRGKTGEEGGREREWPTCSVRACARRLVARLLPSSTTPSAVNLPLLQPLLRLSFLARSQRSGLTYGFLAPCWLVLVAALALPPLLASALLSSPPQASEQVTKMTATPAVIGLSAGNRLLSTSFGPTDLMPDKVNLSVGVGGGGDALPFAPPTPATPKLTAVAAHRLKLSPHGRAQVMRALRHHSATAPALLPPPTPPPPAPSSSSPSRDAADLESSLESILLLQRSMLEKQWELPFDDEDHASDEDDDGDKYAMAIGLAEDDSKEDDAADKATVVVARSSLSARQRRMSGRRRGRPKKSAPQFAVSPELMQSRNRIYLRGTVSKELLTHQQVVHLSNKIKDGIWLQQQRSKLKEKLGNEPSYKQLAHSLKISPPELRSRMRESFLAREILTMSNIRLVISIAQKYDNLGVELADLIQGGLIGLLRGIEKFDASRGFRISTYVYWWIRQGVSRALAENSKTFRLPTYLHERLIAIRGAKYALQDQGIAPTIENIAESLNISEKKVHNATEAVNKVLSLDQQAFPSLNGLPGETLHSYIEDQNVANDPWHGFEELYLKEEVNKLLNSTLNERERDIIRLYHGIGKQCHTWEDISRQFGLSRERVRQVGLIAMEKLKHAARRKNMDALLEDY